MGTLTLNITMSLDGFVAGPDQTLEQPLGAGGERLHEWVYDLATWRERHGKTGGQANVDDAVMAESLAATGAVIMGRRMFSGGAGAWENDSNADGWWGDEPPFGVPVFILTHHAREEVVFADGTTFNFVTDGIEAALEEARAAAEDKNVSLAGGASVAQQYLRAGLIDELDLHIAPVLLGGGVRLFDELGETLPTLEVTRVIESPAVTHIRYRVVR
jgi:dihydrofolate reductase